MHLNIFTGCSGYLVKILWHINEYISINQNLSSLFIFYNLNLSKTKTWAWWKFFVFNRTKFWINIEAESIHPLECSDYLALFSKTHDMPNFGRLTEKFSLNSKTCGVFVLVLTLYFISIFTRANFISSKANLWPTQT